MDLAYTVLIQLIILKTATLFVLIDEETETEIVNDEEEEDLNDVPLFDNSEEHVEPFHLDVDVRIIATNTSVSLTLEQEGLTC